MAKDTPKTRWEKKNDYIVMGIHLYRREAEKFKLACNKRNVSQSGQIRKMMAEFVSEVENNGLHGTEEQSY